MQNSSEHVTVSLCIVIGGGALCLCVLNGYTVFGRISGGLSAYNCSFCVMHLLVW